MPRRSSPTSQAPSPKFDKPVEKLRDCLENSQGQLSIFLAITVVFFITAVAFVINIGLFVKAKINLQNAVDAAAFSGAAVQARQLTDIAYLNWEMRNVYKEWMFKYYVLGNLNAPVVENPSLNKPNNIPQDMMDFTIGRPNVPNNNQDRYNIPSICIQLGNQQYCRIYNTPGIPRMTNQTVYQKDLADFSKEFIDTITKKKAEKCAEASQINFEVARLWAYGLGIDQNTTETIPNIGADRPGAFPKALELALRVRNLEAIVNKAPYVEKICQSGGPGCNRSIQELEGQGVANERTVKAFYSAWRNLGGEKNRELKRSFKMSEMAVRAPQIEGGEKSVSYTFIPNTASEARQKYFLDLQLYSVNLATFYTMLNPVSNDPNSPSGIEDAGCRMSKVAIPIPAYPLGFVKNPAVMTYYAVEGEAEFNGLFNPLRTRVPITAQAIAKPFGGRIGPKLFQANGTFIKPRAESGEHRRSSPYIFGLIPQTSNNAQNVMAVLPTLQEFWVQDGNDVIGGDPTTGLPKFSVPNMHYDLLPNRPLPEKYARSNIFTMRAPTNGTPYPVGLYNKDQFQSFINNLSTSGQFNNVSRVTPNDIERAIKSVRLPTRYDAQNYLIPSTNKLNAQLGLNSYAFENNRFELYAPLYGEGYLYGDPVAIENAVEEYVRLQETSINTFTQTMLNSSNILRDVRSGIDPDADYASGAADIIHDQTPTCGSIAGQFAFYYLGPDSGVPSSPDCPKPFTQKLREFFGGQSINSEYYRETADMIDEANSDYIFSAYSPGQTRGFDQDGNSQNPFTGSPTRDLRNFYSTKFISFDTYREYSESAGLYNEGGSPNSETLANPLIQNQSQPFSQIFR